jgi:hypothetical protein
VTIGELAEAAATACGRLVGRCSTFGSSLDAETSSNVLRLALRWQQRTEGSFHTQTDALRQIWEQAAADNRLPGEQELHRGIDELSSTSLQHLNLNAIAKGWIVDRALDVAIATSSNARRGLTIQGESYGHILDPKTGQPAQARGGYRPHELHDPRFGGHDPPKPHLVWTRDLNLMGAVRKTVVRVC